jgi:ParB family chromosome partitioning protein
MEETRIRLAAERQLQLIPIDQIVVVNPRGRDKRQFEDNVRSIRDVGLYKPIMVNRRNFEKTGKYELICGQGRMTAYQQLGKAEIEADVVDLPESTAQITTLSENVVRTAPEAIEFAKRMKQMRDEGVSLEDLARITGKSESHVREYIQLVENGEERLIKGVESGVFPLSFAVNVASSNERSVQHLLMDAFDNGIIHSGNLSRVRRIIEQRLELGKELSSQRKKPGKYTVSGLVRDIRRVTKEKLGFVHQAEQKENRLFRMLTALRRLHEDKECYVLLEQEGLAKEPELKGKYEL